MERKYVGETITDATRDARNRHKIRTKTENSDTERHRTPRHTGSDCVKIRHYRAAVVCLVLLCVLLLTAVIVLGVTLHDMIEEFYIKNKNHFDEMQGLENNKSNLEKNVQQISNENTKLTTQEQHLQKKIDKLWKQMSKMDGWKCSQSSLYYVSSENKSWIESKRDCTERGAHLIIIDNKQEQEFIQKISGGAGVWIGLTDSDEEGRWKWVDGSTLTSGFSYWGIAEPNGQRGENCVASYSSGWYDHPCSNAFKWICEKRFKNE